MPKILLLTKYSKNYSGAFLAFADVDETVVEETVSVPFVGVDVNPELKKLDLYEPKATDCDVVASSKQKLLDNAKLKLQNANQQ